MHAMMLTTPVQQTALRILTAALETNAAQVCVSLVHAAQLPIAQEIMRAGLVWVPALQLILHTVRIALVDQLLLNVEQANTVVLTVAQAINIVTLETAVITITAVLVKPAMIQLTPAHQAVPQTLTAALETNAVPVCV